MEAPWVAVADLWGGEVDSKVGRFAHPMMVEVLQKVEDLQVVAVDTPVHSMVGQSLWEVEGPAAMEGLAPVLLGGAGQE